MNVMKTAMLFIIASLFVWNKNYAQTATRIPITTIVPSINTGQNYSPWLNDYTSSLITNVWAPINMQTIDVKVNLQTKANISKLSLYDFEGVFTDHPCKIYALNGATKTLIATFYGYQYMQWVDFNFAPVTADAIVVNKWGNCVPMKIKVFGTPVSGGTTPAAITGASTVCVGATTVLANTTTGGVWSSSATTKATVNTSGVVTGVAAGTATISYTKSGASATKVVTVNAAPTAGVVSGAATVTVGLTTPFSSSAPGGTWSSSASYKASVNASGVVTGVAAGTASINYAVTNGCGTSWAWKTVTVNAATTPTPGAGTITGASTVCVGATAALANTTPGGVWSSTATGIATVSAAGVVTGVAAGTATIKYTVGTAVATKIVTVNAAASAGTITGTATVSVGSTTALSNATTGGAWSSTATGTATVNTSGVVTGVAAGTATIQYVVSNSCGSATATKVVTVNAVTPTPGAGTITGASTVCAGATTAYTNATTGGAWSSSSSAVASVSASGVVTGIAAGTATISYTVGTAVATKVITVNALPTAGSISGGSSVVAGSTTALTASVTGGAWSSSSTGVASVNASGVVTGVTAGSATISYTVSNSCGSAVATKAITVTAASTGGGTGGGGTPVTGKIPMDGKRWYILNNCSDGFEGLHDNNLTTQVITGYGTILSNFDAYYAVLPGETINISGIKFYDGPGTSAAFKVYAIDASWNRTLLATYTGAAYNTWVGPNGSTTDFNLAAPANNVKYLVINASNNQYPFEMEVYGSYIAPPAATPIPAKSIKLKQELGVNAFEWDFLHPSSPLVINETRMNAIKSFGAVRHYLDWEKLEPTQGGYTFNPSHSGGWNMDIIYQRAKAEGIDMLVDIKTIPGWFQSLLGGADGEAIPADPGSNWLSPSAYIKQAKLGFQFAARYGSNTSVPTSLLSVNTATRWSGDPANVIKVGLNTVKFIENENERDKWWKGRNAYQTGREYAANLSAFYDGHKNTMGAGVGVKNADPNMKVVMGGVAMPTTDWLEGMIDWCKEFRGYNADGSINICWDVINYHIYPDNNKSMQGGGTRGAAPEVAHVDSFAVKFVRVAHQYCRDMPVWITETGYDLNSGSPLKAIPIGTKSAQITQADWSLRHALLNARAGVEYTYFYMLDDVNASSGTQFSSCGLVNSDFSRRPVADYMWQTKRLMGDYEYKETISANPIVDRYELAGQSIYVVTKPTENGSTMSYTLPVSGAGSVKIYRPTPGQDSMAVSTATVSGGGVALTATETPMFIKVGTASGAKMATTDTAAKSDVLPTTSLNNALAKSIAVYPNPTTGVMQLSVNNDQQGEVNIVVYNAAGQVSKKQVFSKAPGSATQTVDISSLPNGMYIMEITQGTEKATKKVIKVNN